MSSKRAKKKKQKQLMEKRVEITAEEKPEEIAEEKENQVTADEAAQENISQEIVEEKDPEIENEPEISEEELELLRQEQQEKQDFNVMMEDFKTAVEQVNIKDPDQETLIRLFGESDSTSNKEKIIENPEELVDEKDKPKTYLFLRILYALSAVLFTFILLGVGVFSFLDEDKKVSESENRNLAQRPAFSLTALFNGKYTVDFENYYSDNFPGREFFIGVNSKIKNVLTRFSVGENSDVIISVDKNDDDFDGEGIDLGNKNEMTTKPDDEMKDNTAAVTPDNEASIKGSIIISGNRAMEIYTYGEKAAEKYTSIVNKVAASMPDGVQFYSLLSPTAVEFYGTKTYRTGKYSQRDAIKKIYDKLDDDIIKVDAYSAMVEKAEEYIYFRTDHHWTARGAYYAYTAFCKQAQLTAPAIESFETHKIDGFVGSLYRSSQADVLKKNPDYVECFRLQVDATNTVYTSAEMKDGINTYIVAKKVNSDNKYLAFISGDQPLEKITTNVTNGKKILVIKESFGNAFIPFLCNNYQEIYVVDPRQIDMYLPDFVEQNKIQEVMAINYCFGISNSKYCNEMEKLVIKEEK